MNDPPIDIANEEAAMDALHEGYFELFCDELKTIMDFRVEWDDEQWNQAYISFKAWLDNVSPAWVEGFTAEELYMEFGAEYYQDATPDTHDYWLKIKS